MLGYLYWEEWKSITAFKKMHILLAVDIQVSILKRNLKEMETITARGITAIIHTAV